MTTTAAISAPGAVMLVAVVLIVLALVYYLVSTILELRKITKALDEVIGGVSEIIEKSKPVNEIVNAINRDLDAAALLLTTRSQVEQTVAGVAEYGGSLDVIVDDAERS